MTISCGVSTIKLGAEHPTIDQHAARQSGSCCWLAGASDSPQSASWAGALSSDPCMAAAETRVKFA